MKSFVFSAVTALALTVAAAELNAADAATVTLSGAGTFDNSAPTTPYTAAGGTWSFSFTLPNPISANPTTQATGFSYFLNGSPVADTLASVQFFPTSGAGLFDLTFASSGVVSLYGADIGTTLTITPGSFVATIGLNGGSPFGFGAVTSTAVNAVPEASWAMMFAGFAGLGWLGYRRSGKAAVAA